MKNRKHPASFTLFRVVSLLVVACVFPAHGGMIISQPSASGATGHGGWNLDNVNVRIIRSDGSSDPDGSFGSDDGSYVMGTDGLYASDIYNTTYIDGAAFETLMATVVAKDWPVGEPPGIKIVNDDRNVKAPRPENCIISTSYLDPDFLDTSTPVQVNCSSPFQSHKRFKVILLPALVDSIGEESVDLVFNVIDEPGSRDYQVFQKINNWTDVRLQGFTLQAGFGVGSGFLDTSASGRAFADLSISVPGEVWGAEQLATFSHGLFGAADRHFPEGGFFDQQRAGFHIDQYPVASATLDTLTASVTLASKYADIPPGAGTAANQFGAWLPNSWLPTGIFFDDDGNPDTDAVLQAWYGFNPAISEFSWMYGSNRSPDGTDDFMTVSDEVIRVWARDPLFFEDRIEDLVNLNLNYFVSVGDVTHFPDWDGISATFTLRITPKKDTSGTAAPVYAGKTPVPSLVNTDPVGVLTISSGSTFTTGDVLEIYVSDGNVAASDNVRTVVSAVTSASGETGIIASDDKVVVADSVRTVEVEVTSTLGDTEIIILEEVTEGRGVFSGTLATVSDGKGARGNNTSQGKHASMVAVTGTRLRFTYIDADNGHGGKGIPRMEETTAIVNTSTAPPVVSDGGGGGGGGGGCSVGSKNSLSFGIPLIMIGVLGIRMRLRRNAANVIHRRSRACNS